MGPECVEQTRSKAWIGNPPYSATLIGKGFSAHWQTWLTAHLMNVSLEHQGTT